MWRHLAIVKKEIKKKNNVITVITILSWLLLFYQDTYKTILTIGLTDLGWIDYNRQEDIRVL